MDPQASGDRRNGMQIVSRVARLLRALGDAPVGLTLSELAAATDMPKSTVHRLIGALEIEDLVTPASAGRIRLGRGIASLGAATQDQLRDQIRPHIVRLHQELHETVGVGVLDGSAVRLIDHISAPHRLLAVSTTGAVLPLHCTADGKALLAALDDEQVEALLPAQLTALTEHTITTRDALLDELRVVRETGVAYDLEEFTPGTSGVSAVVRDRYGAVAAISVPVPTQRFVGKESQLVRAVTEACEACSRSLSLTSAPGLAPGAC